MALFRELNDVAMATSVCGGWASAGKSTSTPEWLRTGRKGFRREKFLKQ